MNKTFSIKGKEKGFILFFLFVCISWGILITLPLLEGELDIVTGIFMLLSAPVMLGVVFAFMLPSQFPKIVFSSDRLSYQKVSIFYREIQRINLITKEVQGRAAGMGYQDIFLIVEGSGKTLSIKLTGYRTDIEEILKLLIQCSPHAHVSTSTQEFLSRGLDYFVKEKLEKPVKKNPFAWILLLATAVPFVLLLIFGFIKIIVTIFTIII